MLFFIFIKESTAMTQIKTLKYKIIPELNLIIDCWNGKLTFDKILASKLDQVKDKDWNQAYNNISDIRNAVFDLTNEDAKKIIDYTKTDKRWQEKRKTAYLTNNPNQVVFQKLLEINKTQEIPNKIESFYTINAILNWLQINMSEYDKINKIVTKLAEQKP